LQQTFERNSHERSHNGVLRRLPKVRGLASLLLLQLTIAQGKI
jgi:hypothetical protein